MCAPFAPIFLHQKITKPKKRNKRKAAQSTFVKKMRKMLVKLTHGGLEGSEGAIPILIKIL